MKKVLVILGVVAVLAATTFIGFKIGQRSPLISPTNDNLRDTVYLSIIDTNSVSNPDYSSERTKDTIEIKVPVPVPIPMPPDTVEFRDTIYQTIYLPRTEKVYKGEDYRAVVSGYLPSLDTIDIYKRTEYITITERITPKAKHWGIGVQAGVGMNTQFQFVPYVGLGISYNIINF